MIRHTANVWDMERRFADHWLIRLTVRLNFVGEAVTLRVLRCIVTFTWLTRVSCMEARRRLVASQRPFCAYSIVTQCSLAQIWERANINAALTTLTSAMFLRGLTQSSRRAGIG